MHRGRDQRQEARMNTDAKPGRSVSWAWRLGQLAQGLVMGPLLFFAVLGLLALADNVLPFKYQGY